MAYACRWGYQQVYILTGHPADSFHIASFFVAVFTNLDVPDAMPALDEVHHHKLAGHRGHGVDEAVSGPTISNASEHSNWDAICSDCGAAEVRAKAHHRGGSLDIYAGETPADRSKFCRSTASPRTSRLFLPCGSRKDAIR